MAAACFDVAGTAVTDLDRNLGEPDRVGIEVPVPGHVEHPNVSCETETALNDALPTAPTYLFGSRTLTWIGCKQRFPTENARALREKKSAQFRSKERRTVLSPVKFQKETSVGLEESCPHITDEKFPIGGCPFEPLSVFLACYSVEANAMRGDEIKFFAEIRQRRLWINSRDDAANAEELSCAAEKRFIVGVEPYSFVAEKPTEVKKVTRAAAKIENLQRRRAIEPKILHALDVDVDPVGRVFVGVDSSRVRPVRITFSQLFQFGSINRGEHPSRAHRVRPATSVFPQALGRVAGKELLEFARELHSKTMQRTARETSLPSTLLKDGYQVGRGQSNLHES